MSLVWPDAAGTVVLDKPRLHALVIGVAKYPHLNGGSGPLTGDPLNLGQVTTPGFTARAIADWLTTEYTNLQTPLGSVELLLSADTPAGLAAGAATMANVEKAVTAWKNRASAHPKNIAFLYFCGHGLAKEDLFLLPEDYGDPQYASPWRNCINFDGLRVGLWASCRAETQILFVDACREIPFGVLTQVNVEGHSIVGGDAFGSTVKTQAVFYATTEGKQAYGPPDGVSYFGQAVVDCFNGLGTANPDGTWVVDVRSLSAALGRVMEHLAEIHDQPLQSGQRVNGNNAVLHCPPKPYVLASIACSSERATAAAEIVLERLPESYRVGLTDPKPLVKQVEPGDWHVSVRFPNGEYPPSRDLRFTLVPPTFKGVMYP